MDMDCPLTSKRALVRAGLNIFYQAMQMYWMLQKCSMNYLPGLECILGISMVSLRELDYDIGSNSGISTKAVLIVVIRV